MIRESYRLNEEKAGIGKNIVFLAKKNIIDISNITFENVKEDMIKILEKLG